MMIFFTLLMLFSCSDPVTQESAPPVTTFSGSAMTMPYRLLIGEILPPEKQAEVDLLVAACFEETDRIYNKYNPESELSKLNAMKAGEVADLSPQLDRILAETEELVELTEGRFDPTIEPLQALWRKYLEQGKVPPEEEIEAVAEYVGWDRVHLGDGTFYKKHDKTELDLGGIAKGLCVDTMIKKLKRAGYRDLYFEWGGEIATSGHHPDGRPWRVYISALGDRDPDAALATLDVEDEGLATSGDYLQFWVADDEQTYFHIIDPRTRRPLVSNENSIASVSILAPSCELADALATAAMLFSDADEAREWTKNLKAKIPHLEAWVVTRSELADGS